MQTEASVIAAAAGIPLMSKYAAESIFRNDFEDLPIKLKLGLMWQRIHGPITSIFTGYYNPNENSINMAVVDAPTGRPTEIPGVDDPFGVKVYITADGLKYSIPMYEMGSLKRNLNYLPEILALHNAGEGDFEAGVAVGYLFESKVSAVSAGGAKRRRSARRSRSKLVHRRKSPRRRSKARTVRR